MTSGPNVLHKRRDKASKCSYLPKENMAFVYFISCLTTAKDI